MTDLELLLASLLIPMAYVVIYIAGKYDILTLICKMFARRCKEIEKERKYAEKIMDKTYEWNNSKTKKVPYEFTEWLIEQIKESE